MNKKSGVYHCIVCGQNYPIKALTPIGTIRQAITEEIYMISLNAYLQIIFAKMI